MMDAKLKTKLDDAIAAALKWHEKYPKTGPASPVSGKQHPVSGKQHPVSGKHHPVSGAANAGSKAATVDRVAHLVKRKLGRTASWRPLKEQLVMDSLRHLVSKEIEHRENAAAAQDQFVLPGFENLPKRIGRTPIGGTSVRRFLAYAARYEKDAERDLHTLDEIRTVVKTVQPFAATEPSLTVTEAIHRAATMATAPPRALALVAGTKLA